MIKKIYVVGPRPIYVGRPEESLTEAVIVIAAPHYEGEPAKALALELSPALAAHAQNRRQISCEAISEARVSAVIDRGAKDLRTLQEKSRAS